MNITITITSAELSPQDEILIQECLGITTQADLSDAMVRLCKTSFMEYVKMFKEKGLPTRADEVQQERLFFLLKHYYINRIPSENQISSIFQLTQSQSRTLLRNTKSKYRTKINSYIKATLLQTLNTSTRTNVSDPWQFICTSPTIVEEMNMIISQKGPELQPVEKIKGIASKYSCSSDTYDLLRIELS